MTINLKEVFKMSVYITLFFNDRKQEGDNLPLYQNGKMKFDQDIILKAGKFYNIALWKKTENKNGDAINAVSVKIEENDYLNNREEETETAPITNPHESIPF